MNQITQLLNPMKDNLNKKDIIDNNKSDKNINNITINHFHGNITINIHGTVTHRDLMNGNINELDKRIIKDMDDKEKVLGKFYKANC